MPFAEIRNMPNALNNIFRYIFAQNVGNEKRISDKI